MTITASAAARFMQSFREFVLTEHTDALYWQEMSGDAKEGNGHQGEFDACPHADCQLARLDIVELQQHRLTALTVAKDARLAANRFDMAASSSDLKAFPGEANVNARAAGTLRRLADQLEGQPQP